MLRACFDFTIRFCLLLLLLLPGACHLATETGEGTLGIAGAASWTAHDRLVVMLEDGRGTDTLYDGKLAALDTLARLPTDGYAGGQAVFVIQGFSNGELAFEERRSYDGSRQQVVAIDIPFDRSRALASPSLDVWPDQVRLYLGGSTVPLEVLPLALQAGRTLVWKTGNPGVATVSQSGVLTPVGEGSTYVQAVSGDTLRDATAVRVVRDVPILNAGALDTSVAAGISVSFHVTVTQEYGDVAAFAWDLNADGIFEDSIAGTSGQTRFATPPRTFGTGEVRTRFRVRDGEGNAAEAGKLVRVTGSAPKIDSLGAKPIMVTINDSVMFTAVATGSGAELRAFAWDFDGNGTYEVFGGLKGNRATLSGAHAYPQQGFFQARLRIEDANSITISSEVTVTVKLDRPFVDAGPDRAALSGASVRLTGNGTDTLGQVVSREWKCGAAAYTVAGDSGSHLFTAPATAGSTHCVFRVTDDDGLTAEDTLIISVAETNAPTLASFTPADTTLSIRDSIVFAASAAAGTADLKAYTLDIDGDGKAELQGTLTGRTGEIRVGRRFPSEGKFDVTLMVEDQAGKTVKGTARVLVKLDPPKAVAGKDTSVAPGARVTLRGTAFDSLGTVVLREWKIGSGSFTAASGGEIAITAPLTPGTVICVFRVTDDDGQTAEDSVEVTVSGSRDATLASLGVSAGNLDPFFTPQTDTYTLGIPAAITNLTVTPSASHAGATILVNGNPATLGAGVSIPIALTGVTSITVLVTAQDTSIKKPYTLMVIRVASTNANLSNLTVSVGTLAFSSSTRNYTLSVTAASIRLTPTAADSGAIIQVSTATWTEIVASGTQSAVINLAEGINSIDVRVQAPSGAYILYTVTVTRVIE